MNKVINMNGKELDFDAAEKLMDDEIKEELSFELAPCTDQVFFSAYEATHAAKFGSIWELSKANPCW